MDLEEKYAIALGVLSIVLWGAGTVIAGPLSKAPARVIRLVVPLVGLLTLACFAAFVAVARYNVKG